MRLLGSLTELVKLVFRTTTGNKQVEIQPTSQTGSGPVVLTIPDVGDNADEFVMKDTNQTLTNKTIDGDSNTIQDVGISSLKTELADANEAIVRDASGAVVSAKIVDANVDAAAAVAGTKISPDFGSQDIVTNGNVGVGGNLDGNTAVYIAREKVAGSSSGTIYGFQNNMTADSATATAVQLFRTNGATADNYSPQTWTGYLAAQPALGTNSTIQDYAAFRASASTAGNLNSAFASTAASSSASATISSVERTSNVVTVNTTSTHGLAVGQVVRITCSGSAGSPFTATAVNGTFQIASVPSTTSFTYAMSGVDIANTLDNGNVTAFKSYGLYLSGNAANWLRGGTVIGVASAPLALLRSTVAEITTTSSTTDSLAFNRFGGSNNTGNNLVWNTARGSAVGVPTALQTADIIGSMVFQGANGQNFQQAAIIRASVEGTPSSTSMPGRLDFWTTSEGSNIPLTRMTIRPSGRITAGEGQQNGEALTTTVSAKLYVAAGTYTDTATAASGTVSHGTIVAIDDPAIAATNSSVTYTSASTLYVHGAPTGGSNVTITNPFAMFIANGQSYFGDPVLFADSSAFSSSRRLYGSNDTTALESRLSVVGGSAPSISVAGANSTTAKFTAGLVLKRCRSSLSTAATVAAGDYLGRLDFQGHDGTGFIDSALIHAAVDGTPATGDVPGRLVFSTGSAGTLTERARISVNGLMTLNTSAQTGSALSTTAPAKLYLSTGTYTDSSTAASGTVTHGTIAAIDNPAIAATNASVTYTNASTLYIDGAPTNGSNVTITNPWAMYVAGGASYFAGRVQTDGFIVKSKSTLTIASGAVTATKSYHLIAGEGGVADNLATINGGVDGAMLTIRASSDSVDITVDETGNIALSTSTFVLDSNQDTLTLIYDSGVSKWLEVARSNNN